MLLISGETVLFSIMRIMLIIGHILLFAYVLIKYLRQSWEPNEGADSLSTSSFGVEIEKCMPVQFVCYYC